MIQAGFSFFNVSFKKNPHKRKSHLAELTLSLSPSLSATSRCRTTGSFAAASISSLGQKCRALQYASAASVCVSVCVCVFAPVHAVRLQSELEKWKRRTGAFLPERVRTVGQNLNLPCSPERHRTGRRDRRARTSLPSEKQPADSGWATPLPPTPRASGILEGNY